MAASQNPAIVFFKDSKPTVIRIWHWLAFLFFTASVITVLLSSTLFKTKNNIAMVQEQVQQKGGTITIEQARNVAHEYSDKLWMLHKYIGYGLSFLLLWRVIAEVVMARDKKLGSRIRSALSYPEGPNDKKHYLMVQYGYLIFYGLFIVMSLTGLILAFEDVKWLDPLHKTAKNIHEITQYGMYGYILIHLTGVIIADLGQYGGIVSRMINGKTGGSS